MPQMFPMNWILLYLSISTIFVLFMMNNYFTFKYNSKSHKSQMYTKLNWKW